ncbi:MAG: glycosyltransferase family 39 protein [Chloroflexia bacterium]|nr:glycosyltransferase family 39 protein [Chloroflexia bacterium]
MWSKLGHRWSRLREHWPLIGMLIVALALRLYRLTWPGLWTDEGFSILLAGLPPRELVIGMVNDMHPPFFYLLLKLWMLAGDGEFYIRLFPVLCGLSTVVLVYVAGRRMFGPAVGAWAAFYLALDPMHIAYSREIRQYILFVLLCALSACFCWRWAEDLSPGVWGAYVLTTLLAIYTENVGLLLLPFENVFILLSLARQKRWRSLPHWLAGQALVLLGYLPWVPVLGYQMIFPQPSWLVPGSWADLWNMLPHLVFGEPHWAGEDLWQIAAYAWLLAIPLAMGLLLARRREWRWAGLFNWLWLLLVGGVLAFMATRLPIYQEKQFLLLTPVLALLLGVGTVALPKAGRPVLALLFLLLLLPSLHNVYFRHELANHPQREAWKELAAYIDDEARPGDALVFNPGISSVMLNFYLEKELPYAGYPQLYDPYVGSLRGEKATPERLEAHLGPFIRQYERIWLVECCLPDFWDPQRCLPGWMAQWGRPTPLPEFPGLQVRLYEAR